MSPLLVLLGCSFGLETVVDTDRADPGAAKLRVETVDPAWGPPAGGTSVTIVGSGFAGDVVVRFGEAEASEITVVDQRTLEVVTPRVSAEGVVDVTVDVGRASATLDGGYEYTRDRPDDSGGPDGDTGDTGEVDTGPPDAGRVTGLVTFDYSHLACPLCFGRDATDHVTVTASALFHAPADGSWFGWLPAEGSCVSEPSQADLSSTYRDAGDSLTLSDGTRTVTLTGTSANGGTAYAASALTESDWSGGADWSVTAPGGADLPAFTLSSPLRTPAAITTIDPGSITTQNTGSAYSAGFPASGSPIAWSPSGTGDFVVITLEDTSGATVVCRDADDGSFTVPGDAVAGWSPDTQLLVDIVRWDVTEVVLPDATIVELVGRYEIVGTGIVR